MNNLATNYSMYIISLRYIGEDLSEIYRYQAGDNSINFAHNKAAVAVATTKEEKVVVLLGYQQFVAVGEAEEYFTKLQAEDLVIIGFARAGN